MRIHIIYIVLAAYIGRIVSTMVLSPEEIEDVHNLLDEHNLTTDEVRFRLDSTTPRAESPDDMAPIISYARLEDMLNVADKGCDKVFSEYAKYSKNQKMEHMFQLYSSTSKLNKAKIEQHYNAKFREVAYDNRQNYAIVVRLLENPDKIMNSDISELVDKLENLEKKSSGKESLETRDVRFIIGRYLELIGMPSILVGKMIGYLYSYNFKIATARDTEILLNFIDRNIFGNLNYNSFGMFMKTYSELVRATISHVNLFASNEEHCINQIEKTDQTDKLIKRFKKMVNRLDILKKKLLGFRKTMLEAYHIIGKSGDQVFFNGGEFVQVAFDTTNQKQIEQAINVLRKQHRFEMEKLRSSIHKYIKEQDDMIKKICETCNNDVCPMEKYPDQVQRGYDIFRQDYYILMNQIVNLEECTASEKKAANKKIEATIKKIKTITDMDIEIVKFGLAQHNVLKRFADEEIMRNNDLEDNTIKFYPIDKIVEILNNNYAYIKKMESINKYIEKNYNPECREQDLLQLLNKSLHRPCTMEVPVCGLIIELVKQIRNKLEDKKDKVDRIYIEYIESAVTLLEDKILDELKQYSTFSHNKYDLLRKVIIEILPEYKKILIILDLENIKIRNNMLITWIFYIKKLDSVIIPTVYGRIMRYVAF
ncbi:uncharacterized protein NESG_01018 [Nematocida ausubeli]|uniref:Uncharacterized protein n=1 Tax=Nematocida ausubeli (strain ATCC PRA-371 / ERTm2) TaxID=1913371 RepID=A0A086J3Z4_NEMA1|nr:uncharacterized protein NESG_01018 [Nematocida ausubeli]KAI5150626.1 hypothetical protein NEAUS05_2240 [Nematocida ausubeli]KFG26862.1 hypothetical protein NESG_01018 [Nematocida ausubeli]